MREFPTGQFRAKLQKGLRKDGYVLQQEWVVVIDERSFIAKLEWRPVPTVTEGFRDG